ncbi:MAG: NAD(P)H-dependent oxidoreductase [Lentimicrobiaceae bacterium]|nr:NAD(P)H-dependent oxidoreductase [Lentimicrobiaceae bacterium]
MTTIIFAHPWHGSFNKAVLDAVTAELQDKQASYQVIDLNKDGFNPVMTEPELSLFAKGEFLDPLVGKYQQILKETDRLIFIFPLWWSDVPAILKGFFDKVMLRNFAYTATSKGLKGSLTHIRSAKVIVTGQVPKWYLKCVRSNPIQKIFIGVTLKNIGIKKAKWLYCSNSSNPSPSATEKRKRFLGKVRLEIGQD